jgi:hypothetical protein
VLVEEDDEEDDIQRGLMGKQERDARCWTEIICGNPADIYD